MLMKRMTSPLFGPSPSTLTEESTKQRLVPEENPSIPSACVTNRSERMRSGNEKERRGRTTEQAEQEDKEQDKDNE
jgi:hypothetical protein